MDFPQDLNYSLLPMRNVRLALLGEYDPTVETHIATDKAIHHSATFLNQTIAADWISSTEITPALLDGYDGLWVAPGPPHHDVERSFQAIRHARETGMPVFGNCGGFQLLIIEIARHVFGYHDAHHEEYVPSADVRVIVPLACSLRGQELPITISAPSLAARLYGDSRIVERFYCRFGINPAYRAQLLTDPVAVSGSDDDGEIRVIELPSHPFFLGTLYVPQVRSVVGSPHPLVTGFLEACTSQR